MLHLPASNLNFPKLTRQRKENIQSSKLYRLYKENLDNAYKYKQYYLDAKKLKSEYESKDEQLPENLDKWISIARRDAIKYWEASQEWLNKHEEFTANRKYPNV